MKILRSTLIVFSLLAGSVSLNGANTYFRILQDSVYTYSYNRTNNRYELASITYNYFDSGRLDSIIISAADRSPVSKTINHYDGGFLTSAYTFNADRGNWIPYQKQEMTYDDSGFLISRLVTVWRIDHWDNLNTFTYTYDTYGNLTVYHRDFWRVSMWTDFSTDSLFYDENGFLTERTAWLTSTGQYLTRILYNYSSDGLKSFQTRQDFVSSAWVNAVRTLYFYNKCGTQTSSYGERWLNGKWEPDTRSDIYFHYELYPGVRKVPVCHNGRTILIPAGQLDLHLAHGDCLGECIDPGQIVVPDGSRTPESKSRTLPFIAYPNPAGDYINIKLTDQDCPVTGIELADYAGRPVRRVSPDGAEILTIDLSSLKSGNYILRVISDTTYSTVISKR